MLWRLIELENDVLAEFKVLGFELCPQLVDETVAGAWLRGVMVGLQKGLDSQIDASTVHCHVIAMLTVVVLDVFVLSVSFCCFRTAFH